MLCPYCLSDQTFVVNSRPTRKGLQVWRRKKCGSCQKIFTTYEKLDLSHLIVNKRSGAKQKYKHVKLLGGIYKAAVDSKNIDRGNITELVEELTQLIEMDLVKLNTKVIDSEFITQRFFTHASKKAPDILLRYVAYRKGGDRKAIRQIINHFLR